MKVGDNPPEGAILDYYLAAPAPGPVTLTISGADGRPIREYSSIAPPPDTALANVPEYWLAPPVVLPATSGMHRISWDLRYPDPPTLNSGYSGALLDYREYTRSWHALPGQTPLQGTTLSDLNSMLVRAGMAALPEWTPPAAPACGPK